MNTTPQPINLVTIGGLIHDIGKFIQRADGFNIDHSKKGVQYIEQKNNDFLKNKDIKNCISYHHHNDLKNSNLPKDSIAYIVYEADNIASGSERRKDFENEKEYKTKFDSFDKETVLKSVFNLLNTKEKGQTTKGHYLRSLEESENVNMPQDLETNKIMATKDKYQSLKKYLDNNINSIENANSLLALLEATTSYIPSSTDLKETADISLYDHLKLTAAIASCMYAHLEAENISDFKEYCFNNVKEYRNENYFKLVSADISGIQNFIYTIASKGALKSLRARSFYLEIMLEHLADELLEELNLSRANILYTGGGHFYLILPNTKKAEEVLNNFEIKVNDWFLRNFGIDLYIAIASEDCSSNDLMNPKDKSGKRANLTGEIFKKLSKKLSEKKLKRYSKEQLKDIFKVEGTYNQLAEIKSDDSERECKICHTSQKSIKKRGSEDSLGQICDHCYNLFLLGGEIVKPKNKDNCFIITEDKNSDIAVELPSLDEKKLYLSFCSKVELNKKNYKRVYSKNEWATGENFSTNLWMGDYIFKAEKLDKDGKTIDFKNLIKSGDETGVEKLAILRADVDNLGSNFVSGFNQKDKDKKYEYVTISRYATLSRQLSMFFKHYINQFCGSEKLVIIYSGGDDLFIAGAWVDVVKFAINLRQKFKEYTCDKLSFSAGIGFFSPSFPIYKMAELTGELEDLAKNYPNKDAVALFGIDKSLENDEKDKHKKNPYTDFVFSWQELDEIKELEKFIEDRCYFDEKTKDSNKLFLSTALMYKLMGLIKTDKAINIARLAYTLARLEPKENAKNKDSYTKLKNKIYNCYQDEKLRKQLLTAINLLVYRHRENNKED